MSIKHAWARVAAELRACATRSGRARVGCCAVEGTRVFERALRSGAVIRSVLTTARYRATSDRRTRDLFDSLARQGTEVLEAPVAALEELTAGRSIGAIVGLAELPAPQDLDAHSHRTGSLFLGCVGQDDPGNAGALVRTAHALGAAAFLSIGAADPFHPRAVRISMGSVFRLPIVRFDDLPAALDGLRAVGARTLGAVTTGGRPLAELEAGDGSLAVLLGSEAFGLGRDEREALDELVTIPMPSGVDSLSINAAAAVLLYALRAPLAQPSA